MAIVAQRRSERQLSEVTSGSEDGVGRVCFNLLPESPRVEGRSRPGLRPPLICCICSGAGTSSILLGFFVASPQPPSCPHRAQHRAWHRLGFCEYLLNEHVGRKQLLDSPFLIKGKCLSPLPIHVTRYVHCSADDSSRHESSAKVVMAVTCVKAKW